MDTKNVIAAISLSAAVIILYGLFFAPPPPDPKQIQSKENTTIETTTTDAPSLDQNEETIGHLTLAQPKPFRGRGRTGTSVAF